MDDISAMDEAVERAVELLTLTGDGYLAAALYAGVYGEALIPQE